MQGHNITEDQQIQLFVAGLGMPLRTDVALQKPAMLDKSVMLARAYEQRNATLAAATPTSAWQPGRSTHRPAFTPSGGSTTGMPPGTLALTPPSSMAFVNGKSVEIRRLSPAKITEGRKTGKCFHCDDAFTNGRKKVCKQLLIIEAIYDESKALVSHDDTDPTISIHALTSIQPRSSKTMQLQVLVNGVSLTVMLNSGSTHNFIEPPNTLGSFFRVVPGLAWSWQTAIV
jgi:hypothetical protein